MDLKLSKKYRLLFIIALLAGIALFCAGLLNRGYIGVMQKGVRVCLECIGIA